MEHSIPHLLHSAENRKAEMCLAGLFGRHASNHVGAIRESLLDVESTLHWPVERDFWRTENIDTDSLSCQSLAQNLGIFVDEEVLYRSVVVLSGRRL